MVLCFLFGGQQVLVLTWSCYVALHRPVTCAPAVCPVQGVVGTAQGSVHYVSWGEAASVKLVSGHSDVVGHMRAWDWVLRCIEARWTHPDYSN